MSVAIVVLIRVGVQCVPDWKVDNKELLEQLSKLATSLQVVENEKYKMNLMELWEVQRNIKWY